MLFKGVYNDPEEDERSSVRAKRMSRFVEMKKSEREKERARRERRERREKRGKELEKGAENGEANWAWRLAGRAFSLIIKAIGQILIVNSANSPLIGQ